MSDFSYTGKAVGIAGYLQRSGDSLPALLMLWCAYSLLRIAILPFAGSDMGDPDNYMRLLEVRDLLGGQSWFDVRQYRMDPPAGADMHWSRLVDLPLAALIGGLSLALPSQIAETVATVAVPLLYLLLAMIALRSIMLRLGLPPVTVVAGLAAVALFPLLLQTFGPFSIDHHGPQAVAALGCAAALSRAPSRRAALAGGLLAAVWIAISLEGLIFVAALAATYGLRYFILRDHSVAWFLAALALSAPALSFATRPVAEFTAFNCDILLQGHMAAFAVAALALAALVRAPFQAMPLGRGAALALAGLASGAAAYALLGRCAADPFAELDPLVRAYWYDFVLEGLPVWRQLPSVQIMLVWTFLLIPAGLKVAAGAGLLEGERKAVWFTYTAFALAAALYSLLIMRAAIVAQFLTIPFAAVLLLHFLPRARAIRAAVPRILATVVCITMTTPALPSALGKPLDPRPAVLPGKTGSGAAAIGKCDVTRLRELAPGLVFAPLDRGPEILALTGHAVVMSGYHRNQVVMRQVIEGFSGDPGLGRHTIEASGADYLLLCEAEVALYRTRRPDNLANRLMEGEVPDWLESVDLGRSSGDMRVFRIVRSDRGS